MPTNVIDEATGREVILPDAFAYNGQYEVKATGYSGTATLGTTTNVDFAIGAEDRYINGISLFLKDHVWGDTLNLSVVDVDNIYGYGAGLVLKTFGINWNVNDQTQSQGSTIFNYVARIPAGIYIRIVYTSTGTTDVKIRLNCLMHKKL
jgi:hypothetical protein